MQRHSLRHGFTVWELLAVILIILVVAAILFPVFASHSDKSPATSCASNLKQLGLAILQYTQDNDERYPDIADKKNPNATWRTMIYPYIKSTGIYQCPRPNDKTLGPDGLPASYAANSAGITYSGKKGDQGNGVFAGPGSKPLSLADFDHPERLIAACEVSHHTTPDFNIDSLAAFDPQSRALWAGHTDRSNYLFADGHVKSLRPMDTQTFWHRSAVPLTPNAIDILQGAQNAGGRP